MRALVLGLVGVVMAAGAAEAAGRCPRTYTLTSTQTEAFPPRAGLVGSIVKEIRRTSGPKVNAIEVAGKPGRFVIRYSFALHAVPGTTGASMRASRSPKIAWNGKTSPGIDRAGIYSGPLTGLFLEQNSCN